jgi:hypothetical protein
MLSRIVAQVEESLRRSNERRTKGFLRSSSLFQINPHLVIPTLWRNLFVRCYVDEAIPPLALLGRNDKV